VQIEASGSVPAGRYRRCRHRVQPGIADRIFDPLFTSVGHNSRRRKFPRKDRLHDLVAERYPFDAIEQGAQTNRKIDVSQQRLFDSSQKLSSHP
jgi:hypothetical protein